AALHSSYLGVLHYLPDTTLERLYRAHREYEARHAAASRPSGKTHANSSDPERPLRLGFVSPHFERHPVGYFLIRALEHLDRAQVEIVCYSDTASGDDLTARFKACASCWRDVLGTPDGDLAEQIEADRIDILFDLAGHTGGNRLLVFARKPAPIQITWLDYEGTTGLTSIDYILADRFLIPPESEPWYSEKVLRLPDGFICYDPPIAPAVSPLPALPSNGVVTFGSFNLPAKITPKVVDTWAQILQQVTRSRLILKYRGLDDTTTSTRLHQLFADRNVAPERIELQDWSPYAEFL